MTEGAGNTRPGCRKPGWPASESVFARGYLLDYCRREGIACRPFVDFAQVEAFLRREG